MFGIFSLVWKLEALLSPRELEEGEGWAVLVCKIVD